MLQQQQSVQREMIAVRINGEVKYRSRSQLIASGWRQCGGCHTWFPKEMRVESLCEQCIDAENAWGSAAPGETNNTNRTA